jgi:hypothetical protein
MCGEVFETRRLDALWCSTGCRVKAHRGEWHPELEPRPKPTAEDLAEAAQLAPLIAWARQQGGRVRYELEFTPQGVPSGANVGNPYTAEGVEKALAWWDAEEFCERWWDQAPEAVKRAREEAEDLPAIED